MGLFDSLTNRSTSQPTQRSGSFLGNSLNNLRSPERSQKQEGGLLKALFSRLPQESETAKPMYDIWYQGQGPSVQIPRFYISFWEMYELSMVCPEVRLSIEQIAKETLRNGLEWKPKWSKKCLVCGEKYAETPHIDWYGKNEVGCKECQVPGTLMDPPNEQTDYARWLFNHTNNQETEDIARQDIEQVLYEVNQDLDTVDNSFVILVKHYYYDDRKKEVYFKINEIMRGHPLVMRIVSDDRGSMGGRFLSCPLHRDYVLELTPHSTGTGIGGASYIGKPIGQSRVLRGGEEIPKFCPQCAEEGRNVELRQIWYVATEMGGNRPTAYFFADEVVHLKAHSQGLMYGIPPILTLYRYIRAIVKQVEYVQMYFERRRIPRGVLLVRRSGAMANLQAVPQEMEIDQLKEDINRRASDDPHDIPVMAVSGDDVQFQPFADTIREMDYIALRQEIRNQIGAYYGVPPQFLGDTSVGPGYNNEGTGIVVMRRSVEYRQKILNNLLDIITRQLGITDWTCHLAPNEERDETVDRNLRLLDDQHAMLLLQMGFDVWINDQGEYESSHERQDQQDAMEEALGGLMGGGEGGGGGLPGMDMEGVGEDVGGISGGAGPSAKEEARKQRKSELVPYRGPRGGTGMMNPRTGRTYYGYANKERDSLEKAVDDVLAAHTISLFKDNLGVYRPKYGRVNDTDDA